MIEINTSYAICLGKQKRIYNFRGAEESICGECKRPVIECEWLLHGKAVEGSSYYTKDCHPSTGGTYTLYVIVDCPKHE